jgi:hypothetical protein
MAVQEKGIATGAILITILQNTGFNNSLPYMK